LCLKNNIKMKLNMYSVWHNNLFSLLIYYWLLVLVWIGHHQANIYRNLKILRPKLVANNRNNTNKIIVGQMEYIFNFISKVCI
jgi:hypothetical protein